jgi:hypothetical protein
MTSKTWKLVTLQISHYLRTQRNPALPRWYETQRKTTMVVFWS